VPESGTASSFTALPIEGNLVEGAGHISITRCG
jgi:hypothetical protein